MTDFQKRVSEIDTQIESATASLRSEKDALATSHKEELAKLTADLEKAKSESDAKHGIGMRWKSRADQLAGDVKNRNETIATRDQTITELNEKVETITKELEGTKSKISELEKKVADTERGSHAKDLTVQRLQSELSKAQAGQGSPAAGQPAAPADDSAELVCLYSTFRHCHG